MKKSQLRNIIKESIKELITEQSNLPTGLPIMVNRCGGPVGGNFRRYLVEEPNGTVRNPQVGDVWCDEGVTSSANNWQYYTQHGCRMNTVQILTQCDGCDYSNLIYGTGNYVYGALPSYSQNPQLYGLNPHGNGQCQPSCGYPPRIKKLLSGCNDTTCPDGPTATSQGNCSMNMSTWGAGCTDSNAFNYNSTATIDDGSCDYGFYCKDTMPGKPGLFKKCTPGNQNNPGPFATLQDCLDSGCEPKRVDKDDKTIKEPNSGTPPIDPVVTSKKDNPEDEEEKDTRKRMQELANVKK